MEWGLSSDKRRQADPGGRAGRLLSLYESAAQSESVLLPEDRAGLGAGSPHLAHHADPAAARAASVAEAAEPRPLPSPPSPSLAVKEPQRLARSGWTPGAEEEREQAQGDWKGSMRPPGAASAPTV